MAEIYHTVLIPLTQGKFAIVDFDDHPLLVGHKWHVGTEGYAKRFVGGRNSRKVIYMHRVIAGFPKLTDHDNRNRLDNRRINLIKSTRRGNTLNAKLYSSNKSGAKGVYFCSTFQRWKAVATYHGKRKMLGTFRTKEGAIAARKQYEVLTGYYRNSSQ